LASIQSHSRRVSPEATKAAAWSRPIHRKCHGSASKQVLVRPPSG
jgi:hypothetical protein